MNDVERILLLSRPGRGAEEIRRRVGSLADLLNAELHEIELDEISERHHEAARSSISTYLDDHEIDLLVLAPFGRYHGERYVVEPIIRTLIDTSPCDVITFGFRALATPRFDLNRVVAVVDYSAHSAAALERARLLTREAGGHLTVLHLLESEPTSSARPEEIRRRARENQKAYADLKAFYRAAAGPDVPHQFVVMRGNSADRVVRYARKHFDLVVQGIPERSARNGLGYDPIAVMRNAACSVWTVVPAEHRPRSTRRGSSPNARDARLRRTPQVQLASTEYIDGASPYRATEGSARA